MKVLGLIVFATVGGFLLYWGVVNLWEAKAGETWPTAPGKIVSSSVESKRTYEAKVVYEYTVNGKVYSSGRLTMGNINTGDPGRARLIVDRYPPGKAVTVHYSPQDPSRCLLEPGLNGGLFLVPSIGAVFFLMGILCFKYAGRRYERTKREWEARQRLKIESA
jgi:hypothetical protein